MTFATFWFLRIKLAVAKWHRARAETMITEVEQAMRRAGWKI